MKAELEQQVSPETEVAIHYTSEMYGIVWCEEYVDVLVYIEKLIGMYEEFLPNTSFPCLYRLFMMLGHWNLLLHHYAKAMSAYHNAIIQNLEGNYDKHILYGLGLCYFHFGINDKCCEVLQRLLWLYPQFGRIKEVMLLIAYSYKDIKAYDQSERFFKMMLKSEEIPKYLPISKAEVFFSMGHLCHLMGNREQARYYFENAISETPSSIPKDQTICKLAAVLYEMGLSESDLHRKHDLVVQSINLCNQALSTVPDSQIAQYLIGRCLSVLGRSNEAFCRYRSCVDQMPCGADIWCSIGNLYQTQNQISDALQAYVCAIQIRSDHYEAWYNVGILYEQIGQLKDAATSYAGAARFCQNLETKAMLEHRSNTLKEYLTLTGRAYASFSHHLSTVSLECIESFPQSSASGGDKKDQRTLPMSDKSKKIWSMMEKRKSEITCISQLKIFPIDEILPYTKTEESQLVENYRLRIDPPTPSFNQVSGSLLIKTITSAELLQKSIARIHKPDCTVALLKGCAQALRLPLQSASTAMLAKHSNDDVKVFIATQPVGTLSDPYCSRISSANIPAPFVTSTLKKFARYQALNCDQITTSNRKPRRVSYARLPVSPLVVCQILCDSSVIPAKLRPNQANNLLYFCPPLAFPSMMMCVPGVRIAAAMEPYRCVYLNVGPGDIMWFIAGGEAAFTLNTNMRRSCGLDCWDRTNDLWPRHDDLPDTLVCVTQRPGDMVVIQPDAVHWGAVLGWLNIIRWNLCPRNSESMERLLNHYEMARMRMAYRPAVPMYRLAFTLSIESLVTEATLFRDIKKILHNWRSDEAVSCCCVFCETRWLTVDEGSDYGCCCCNSLYHAEVVKYFEQRRDVWPKIPDSVNLYIPILSTP